MRFLGGICGVAVVWSFVECGRVVTRLRLFGVVEAGNRSMEEDCVYGRLERKEEEGG